MCCHGTLQCFRQQRCHLSTHFTIAIQLYHVLLSSHDPALITMETPLEFCGSHVRCFICNNDHATPRIIKEGPEALCEVANCLN